jgi:hypothetical protein
MFAGVITGFLQTSRVVHGHLLIDISKFLGLLAHSFFSAQEAPNKIKGFTAPLPISSNDPNGVHGFTGNIPQTTPAA